MARKKRSSGRRSSGFGGASNGFVNDALAGAGAAAMVKRFLGAPIGNLSGIAGAGAYAMITRKNIMGYAAGAAVHDFIGNVGASGTTSGTPIYS